MAYSRVKFLFYCLRIWIALFFMYEYRTRSLRLFNFSSISLTFPLTVGNLQSLEIYINVTFKEDFVTL
jgi:hypothetical protein